MEENRIEIHIYHNGKHFALGAKEFDFNQMPMGYMRAGNTLTNIAAISFHNIIHDRPANEGIRIMMPDEVPNEPR